MIFETERLTIRRLAKNDLEGFYDLHRNPRVMQFTNGKVMSFEENEADLSRVILAYSKPENNFWVWAIERKGDADFVGTCALIVNEAGETEIGYRIREQFWGKGYGKEVAGQLIRYALSAFQLKTLVAYAYSANEASVKILERYMQLEKEFFNEEAQCLDRKYVLNAPDQENFENFLIG